MMSLQKTFYQICFAELFLLVGCHRDVPIPPSEKDDVRQITFKLSGFESEVASLSGRYIKRGMALSDMGMQALHNLAPSPESQYLYYWSFNDETLEPDIAVDEKGVGVEADADLKFGTGFASDVYEAGDALSMKGVKTVEMNLPVVGISSFADFSFDISSSNTGPKDFLLSYSIDGGDSYEVLAENNQFEKMGAQARNEYTFDISVFPQFIGVDVLKLKFDFLAGNRDDDNDYNESAGVVKLDNIRLSGVYNGEVVTETDPSMPSTLHYYVFSSDDGTVVAQQKFAMDELEEGDLLTMNLTEGTYDVLFLAYQSDRSLLLPEDLTHASEFYFGQEFDDHRAVTYALLRSDLEVGDTDVAESAVLTRCFSLIKFNFADLMGDLQKITKITVTRSHENYLYTPFGIPSGLPMSDAQSIAFSDFETTEDFQIAFHQFFGLIDEGHTYDVNYELTAYGADEEVLRSVTVAESIRNNVQLLFSGKLLGDLDRFAIDINPDWDDTIEQKF
ncbi:hypothetical protein [Parapedobacter indicus]|uniref:Uncharacterized protein n=1 Tax=Parapedobacter indicus TaxID=1477437 RepID=A0A1I3LRT5_9SPHI|nr:hypothetical protein [Parapedobacter indicus]PPL01405.1 hypothetical protein CLV26_106215 [Parapedobacter indicus]SFI87250.1 hypothetical protein SAMN05444682_106120 [Parapedobacter indicus]